MKACTNILKAALPVFCILSICCGQSPGSGGTSSGGLSEVKGNVVNGSWTADLKGFDPVDGGDTYSGQAINMVYEGLMQYHYLKRPFQVEPCLADGEPDISEDLRVYTFKIKKGVFFIDDECFPAGKGREAAAEDFIFSFKRIADVKTNSTGYWIFEGKIKGLDDFREHSKTSKETDYNLPIEGLQAPDPHTLQIKLTEAYPQLLYVLAMPYTKAVPREAVEYYGQEFLNHPVGTGPYKLSDWIRNSKVIFTRNEAYRDDYYPSEGGPGDRERGLLSDAGKKIPFTDQVVIHIMVESQPRWLNFMTGRLDQISIPKDSFDFAIDASNELKPEVLEKGIELFTEPSLDLTYMGFNMEDPVLGYPNPKSKLIRQAMSLAYYTKIRIKLLRNDAWAVKAWNPLPPGMPGYESYPRSAYKVFDPDRARKLLAEAGYPEGKGLPVLTYENSGNDTTARQFAELFADMMKQIGIRIKINANTWPEFDDKVKNARAQMFGMAWGADYPDPENFLQLFYGPNSSPGPNGCNYKNPEYDRLYEKMAGMSDSPERRAIIAEMIKIVNEDCPMIYMDHRLIYSLKQAWLENYKFHDIQSAQYKYYKVDQELKSRLLKEVF